MTKRKERVEELARKGRELLSLPGRKKPDRSVGKVALATAAGLAAAAAGAAAVAFASRGRDRDGARTVFRVRPEEEGWAVRSDGGRATSYHETKKQALATARRLARRHEPSRLVIHAGDGSVQRAHDYDGA